MSHPRRRRRPTYDEYTIYIGAHVDGELVGCVTLGPTGGWRVSTFKNGRRINHRGWHGSKASARAELERRLAS